MKKGKIIVRIIGGIGNQLFCYAAARRLALKNDAELVIDHVSGFIRDTYSRRYELDRFNIPCRKANRSERLEPFSRIRRVFQREINRKRAFEKRSYIKQEGSGFDPRLLWVQPDGTIYIEGYWQSEDYFKDVESVIRSDLQIRSPVDKTNLKLAETIRRTCSIAAHVRFFDAPAQRTVVNAPGDYYAHSVAHIENRFPNAHYFVFSNRPEVARACIPIPDDRVTCVTNNRGDLNAYADLWLMSQCRHHIIASSSFSWWGAWLPVNENKVVIAPDPDSPRVSSAWRATGLVPKEWVRL